MYKALSSIPAPPKKTKSNLLENKHFLRGIPTKSSQFCGKALRLCRDTVNMNEGTINMNICQSPYIQLAANSFSDLLMQTVKSETVI
jgi:hypothetical protein